MPPTSSPLLLCPLLACLQSPTRTAYAHLHMCSTLKKLLFLFGFFFSGGNSLLPLLSASSPVLPKPPLCCYADMVVVCWFGWFGWFDALSPPSSCLVRKYPTTQVCLYVCVCECVCYSSSSSFFFLTAIPLVTSLCSR